MKSFWIYFKTSAFFRDMIQDSYKFSDLKILSTVCPPPTDLSEALWNMASEKQAKTTTRKKDKEFSRDRK